MLPACAHDSISPRHALLVAGCTYDSSVLLVQEGFEDVYDEFDKYGVSVDAYFVDAQLQAWVVPAAALYSHTASDFAHKLHHIGLHLGGPQEMAAQIADTADIAFPVIHGAFGEDGRLAAALQDAGVQYVGSEPEAMAAAFNKASARQRLLEAGFPALEQMNLLASDFVDLEAEDCKLTVSLLLPAWAAFECGHNWVGPKHLQSVHGLSCHAHTLHTPGADLAMFSRLFSLLQGIPVCTCLPV